MTKSINVRKKLVLLRIDINSAIDSKGRVIDSPRFIESAKTIKKLLNKGARLVIIAHQGRKGGKDFIPLRQHARILSKHAGRKVNYVGDLFGKRADNFISKLKTGQAVLMKNLRVYDEETHPEINPNRFVEFSKKFDLYINDAFSDSHRAHSSIIIPPKHISSILSGNFANEVKKLDKFALHNKFNNTIIILGGSKVEDYFPLFRFLENKTNRIIAGGVIGNLFLKIEGHALGYEEKWLKKHSYFRLLKPLARIYHKHRPQIILPVDFAPAGGKREEFSISRAPFKKKIMDVGHESVELFKAHLSGSKRIIIKGPLGFSEYPQFRYATNEILRYLSNLHKTKSIPVLICGGHLTTTAYKNKSLKFSHASLAGGATISYIAEGEKGLPGMEIINSRR